MQFKKIKPGEMISYTGYAEVLKVTPKGILVRGPQGDYEISGPKFIEQSLASDSQFTTEKVVTRTELVEKLLGAGDSIFTVDYVKQDGKPRTLTGHLIGSENHMGRSNVIDLRITSGSPARQVDHRTVNSLVLHGVKYTVKK